ncbi:transcriptional regulator, PadR-like family [Catenulispora acidiphila DSM 44928]|uniref:Transcriptional regulator, PadR-like family n=1 Tax=Catenulispora acidiphila (strain DSM 44928 / JCM 14897 / NBRC 102108 / NRRL B-24433 / ID139908) TaxID=479433 RepID=C7QA58_CATAD|nr:PadR family transcriptional regulator [Catenulispora acidiphila]ACU70456.1 transcriptional regulator, PadR-like family [Catenulispora acidiphila DSM 44928]
MLEFAILGFLFEARLHGYELRKRLAALTGHIRPIADGTLYPAIKRLVEGCLVIKNLEAGSIAAPRHMLELTPAGRDKLLRMLREPPEVFVTDENHWFCLLAFLRHLDDPAAQAAVLRRRLEFLSVPASFFYEDDHALSAEEVGDPFRRGVLEIARVTSRTELKWLDATIEELDELSGHSGVGN